MAPPRRLIFKPVLLERVPYSYTTNWKMMNRGTFPRGRDVGGRTAWLESEVDDFINNLPLRRLKCDGPLPPAPRKRRRAVS